MTTCMYIHTPTHHTHTHSHTLYTTPLTHHTHHTATRKCSIHDKWHAFEPSIWQWSFVSPPLLRLSHFLLLVQPLTHLLCGMYFLLLRCCTCQNSTWYALCLWCVCVDHAWCMVSCVTYVVSMRHTCALFTPQLCFCAPHHMYHTNLVVYKCIVHNCTK